tara:strand:- start:2064 stop:2633 length:570 start_codon:yes stop_codon:yes gene_type:complete
LDYKKIKRLRKIYIIISIIIGITAPLLCYFLLPTFNIKSEPLSKFGISTQTSKIWFWSLIIISLGLWLNGEYRIKELIKREPWKPLLKILLRISVLCLILTAVIDMSYHWTHKIVALIFFCGYNLFVFTFGLVRSLNYLKRGIFSVTMGTLMLLTSLLVIPFPSYGIAEIAFIILISIWNTKILFRDSI